MHNGRHRTSGPPIPENPEVPESRAALVSLHKSGLAVPGQPVVVDTLRYTMIFPEDRYTEAASAVRKRMAERGAQLWDAKNFWRGASHSYVGINDVWSLPCAHADEERPEFLYYEIQYHTQA